MTVDRFDNLIRSGRVSRGKAWLGSLLDIRPLLDVDAEGRIQPAARVRGKDQVVPRVLTLLEQRLTPRPTRLRFGIAHAWVHLGSNRMRPRARAFQAGWWVLLFMVLLVLWRLVGPGV